MYFFFIDSNIKPIPRPIKLLTEAHIKFPVIIPIVVPMIKPLSIRFIYKSSSDIKTSKSIDNINS